MKTQTTTQAKPAQPTQGQTLKAALIANKAKQDAKKAAPAQEVAKTAQTAKIEKKTAGATVKAIAKETKTVVKPVDVVPTKKGVSYLLAFIVNGIEQRKGYAYYKRAIAYHAKQHTQFPRPLVDEARLSLTVDIATEVFKQADNNTLAAGSKNGQACFDVYMMALQAK